MSSRVVGTLTVGQIASRSGLMPRALRHYDRLGLLVPEEVSSEGYRWYSTAQLATAVVIARLRSQEVPLPVVRAIVMGAPDAEVRRMLTGHRSVLQARDDGLRRAPHSIDHLLNGGREICIALTGHPAAPDNDERQLAAQLFNDAWALLDQDSRTPDQDDRMIHLAHESRPHWDNVGDDQNRAIGEWQIARVYATLGRGEAALFHAHRCGDYARRDGTDDWVLASAHEGLARAFAVSGDLESARDAREKAVALSETVADAEDRRIVAVDLDTLPIC